MIAVIVLIVIIIIFVIRKSSRANPPVANPVADPVANPVVNPVTEPLVTPFQKAVEVLNTSIKAAWDEIRVDIAPGSNFLKFVNTFAMHLSVTTVDDFVRVASAVGPIVKNLEGYLTRLANASTKADLHAVLRDFPDFGQLQSQIGACFAQYATLEMYYMNISDGDALQKSKTYIANFSPAYYASVASLANNISFYVSDVKNALAKSLA